MTEFSKIKIPFALALLAAMFAIDPIVVRYGQVSYLIFNISISISFIHLVFCSFLGASVYFYALGLVGENFIFKAANQIGHFVYAVALVIPPLSIVLYYVSLISAFIVKLTESSVFSKIIEYGLTALVGVSASLISNIIIKTFSKRDKTEKVEKLSAQENQVLKRAKDLFEQGYYDLSVSESWKAVELALIKAFINIGEKRYPKNMQSILELAVRKNIINETQVNTLKRVIKIRNESLHTTIKIDRGKAIEALQICEKIIVLINFDTASCYFCNKEFPKNELETEELSGANACKYCAEKIPDWQERVIAMGMDP